MSRIERILFLLLVAGLITTTTILLALLFSLIQAQVQVFSDAHFVQSLSLEGTL